MYYIHTQCFMHSIYLKLYFKVVYNMLNLFLYSYTVTFTYCVCVCVCVRVYMRSISIHLHLYLYISWYTCEGHMFFPSVKCVLEFTFMLLGLRSLRLLANQMTFYMSFFIYASVWITLTHPFLSLLLSSSPISLINLFLVNIPHLYFQLTKFLLRHRIR